MFYQLAYAQEIYIFLHITLLFLWWYAGWSSLAMVRSPAPPPRASGVGRERGKLAVGLTYQLVCERRFLSARCERLWSTGKRRTSQNSYAVPLRKAIWPLLINCSCSLTVGALYPSNSVAGSAPFLPINLSGPVAVIAGKGPATVTRGASL